MTALVTKYRVIAVDLRGHGHSSAPEDGSTPRGFADDLAALLHLLDTGPVVAVGHSMGGAVVAALAVEHPSLVRAIVPVDAAYGMDGPIDGFIALGSAFAEEDGHDRVCDFFRSAFYSPASPPHLAYWHTRRIRSVPAHVLWSAFLGMGLPEDQFAMKPQSEAYLARITVPALAFRAGFHDPSAVATWERGCFAHPYSRAVGWEGTGHFLHQERPNEFNAVLTAWLDGLPA